LGLDVRQGARSPSADIVSDRETYFKGFPRVLPQDFPHEKELQAAQAAANRAAR
jgi:hypothetical protein